MQVSDFNYDLPEELIAQEPPPERGASRMLVVSRKTGAFRDDEFRNLSRYVRSGDCLVLNNTRVVPARLRGRRNWEGGAAVEVLLAQALDENEKLWKALVRPARRVRTQDRIVFGTELSAIVVGEGEFGERTLLLEGREPISDLIERVGEMPLPPYVHREASSSDRERYQTIFAAHRGSVAAPTAGLHFTQETLAACSGSGATFAEITLHVGLGTFAPLRKDSVSEIKLHNEQFEISRAATETMRKASRLICVGTTSTRAIETALLRSTSLEPVRGSTDLFIYPGFQFRGTGALLTNFHLPKSSLLMLVAAFAGRELVLAAYQHAVRERYRFFSYGDCMFIE